MKVFQVKKTCLSMADALVGLLEYDNKEAFAILSGSEYGYYLDEDGHLSQVDICENLCTSNFSITREELEDNVNWSIYTSADTDNTCVGLTCLD